MGKKRLGQNYCVLQTIPNQTCLGLTLTLEGTAGQERQAMDQGERHEEEQRGQSVFK